MSSLSSRIAWNTLSQMAGKFTSTLFGLGTIALITRYISVSEYGSYTFVFVLVMMFGSVADWGLTLITVREASRNESQQSEIIGNAALIRFFLAIAATLFSNLTVRFFSLDPLIWSLTGIASLLLVAQSIKTSFQIVFQVKLQMHNWAICEVVANLVIFLLVIGVILTHGTLGQLIGVTVLGNFIAALLAAVLGYRLLPLKLSFSLKDTKYLLVEALPMGSLLVIFTIYNRVDTLILAHYFGNTPVGIYGLSYRIYEVLVLGAAYFSNSLMPLISNLAQKNKIEMGKVYNKSFVMLFWLGLMVALGNLIFAPLTVYVVAGKSYLSAVWPLRIISLGLIVSYFNHLNGYTLIALNKQWHSFFIAVGALGLNLTLNILLIPHFSYNAAAFNTVLTEGFIMLVSLLVIRKAVGFSPSIVDFIVITKEIFTKKGKIFN